MEFQLEKITTQTVRITILPIFAMITPLPRVIKIFLYPILNIQEPSFMGAQLPPGPRAHPR